MPQNLEERLAAVEDSLTSLRGVVDSLQKLVSTMFDVQTADSRNEMIDDARVMAIYSIVLELAERAGVDRDAITKHFASRQRWWHDYFLRRAEDVSPERAAELDPRTIEQAGVSQTYPSIFDPPENG
jgi:hypothetical protein